MNEYIVTCKSMNDLNSLYDDMETVGGSLYIPDRAVDLVNRRTISRNTHYMLTESEAEQIKNDSRVLACERTPADLGIKFERSWKQTGDFDKTANGSGSQNDDKNWGLYRINKGATVSNWGLDGTPEISNRDLHTTWSGKNVDVVIVDSHLNVNHPEFAVNVDGSGGTRVVSYNWFQHKNSLGYSGHPTNYTYSATNSSHGTHVAGTACGNTQGWARDANIYNLDFMTPNQGINGFELFVLDYVRAFHNNKSINSSTGRKNPTVCNNSWGGFYIDGFFVSDYSAINYRGTTTTYTTESPPVRVASFEARGVPCAGVVVPPIPARNPALDADVQDCINDGIIMVGAAGNNYFNNEEYGGVDYNNTITKDGITYPHSRGSSPSAGSNCICVGNIDSRVSEHKNPSSQWGGRVDVWAPGSNIMSASYSQFIDYYDTVADPRNGSYFFTRASGTSMASPQVTGLLACLCEQEPNLTQAEALQYIKESALSDVADNGSNPNQSSHIGFGDSSNRYLFDKRKRPTDGMAHPAVLHKNRNTTTAGVKYPRVRNNRTTK